VPLKHLAKEAGLIKIIEQILSVDGYSKHVLHLQTMRFLENLKKVTAVRWQTEKFGRICREKSPEFVVVLQPEIVISNIYQ